jgi:hypothetical protein
MGQPEARRHAGGDRDGPVDPRRDQAGDPFGPRHLLDPLLVLGRDERVAVGVAQTDGRAVAVADDGSEPARAGGAKQP